MPDPGEIITPPHLVTSTSDRGFRHYPMLICHGGEVRVYESSAAAGPHLWLDVHGSGHLTAEEAWQLADQLRHAVIGHYQGDARPGWALLPGQREEVQGG